MIPHILSIQSHVARGYVGNRAAVFPLQRLGCEVNFINTVQFSNHTGYGEWTGEIYSAEHIQDVLNGLWKNNTFDNLNAILSGYQGSPALGQVIIDTVKQVKQAHPQTLYCCDPVLGDVGRGVYVLPETAEFIKQHAINVADIITPNHFELGYLTDMPTHNISAILNACAKLHARGPKIILVTSLVREEAPADHIEMLLSCEQGVFITRTPRFEFDHAPSGSGDATAAIFLAKYLQTQNVVQALEHTTAAIYDVFKITHATHSYELQLIAAQDFIVNPSETFSAKKYELT
jgi:pyridoxine kinase